MRRLMANVYIARVLFLIIVVFNFALPLYSKIRVKINKPLKIKGLSTLFGVISSVLLLIYYV